MKGIVIFITISILYTLLFSSPLSIAVGANSLNIFTPESKPYGLSYEEHAKNYWKWVLSLPKDKNTYNDNTGAKCTNGQSSTNSSVFYLSGGGGGKFDRTCKVPAGKGVLIPVMVVEVSDKEVPNRPVEDLHAIAKKDQDSVTSLYLKINDKEYLGKDLNKYRTHTKDFQVVFPKEAIFGVSEGISKVVADGYYIITEPLTKGTYTIHFKSSLICAGTDCLEPNFAQDMKYTIIVE